MVTFIELKNATIEFVEKELVNNIDNQFIKMGVISAVYVLDKKSTNIYNTIRNNAFIKTLELIDANGNIDDETLLDAIKTGMKGQSLSFDTGLLGTLTIVPEDIDKLKGYLRKPVQATAEQLPLV